MEYTKTTWVNGETALNADNMNNIENGIERAKSEINNLYSSKENSGVAEQKVNQHNIDTNSHQDIRSDISLLSSNKFDKTSIVEEFGNAKDKVVSQDFFSNNVRWRTIKEISLDGTSSGVILALGDLGRTLYNDISIKVELPSEPSTTDDKLRFTLYDGSKSNYTNLQIFSTDITLAHYMFKRCGGIFILYEIKPVLVNGGINSSSIKYAGLYNAVTYLDKVDKIEIRRMSGNNFLSGTKFTIYANW